MPSSCDYNCADLPVHEQIECGDNLHGGISAIGILECDHTITDFESASEWNTNIASGKANIVRQIRGEKPEPSPVEVENPNACGSDTVLDTFDRTYEFTDDNVSAANQSYYDALNGRTTNLAVYYCQDEDIEVIEYPVTWEYKLDELSGIPLTEEWLMKFGLMFEQIPASGNSNYGMGIAVGSTWLVKEVTNWAYTTPLVDYAICYLDSDDGLQELVEVKYVHQLQNLYFALTGEELEYNP